MVRRSLTILMRVTCGFSHRKSFSIFTSSSHSVLTPISGIPHSIQALDDGVEFLLVFDQGDFNEDNTFLATEVFLHSPVRRHHLPVTKALED